MDTVLLLIASPRTAPLEPAHCDAVAQIIAARAPPNWLARGIAVEFYLADSTPLQCSDYDARLRRAFAGEAIDICFVPAQDRRKQLLIADMDSTMIGQECIDELADAAGIGAQIKAITARAMAGELEFAAALTARVAALKDLPETVIDEVLRERISLAPGGPVLVKTMKAHGAHTALVSGGFTRFSKAIAAQCGFHSHHANELIIEDGFLTGEVGAPILGSQAKLETLQQLCSRFGIAPSRAIAVGDGANDLPMLMAAGMGVALHAKPLVRTQAPLRLDHSDLTGLLYLQGYRADDFVGES